MLKYVNVGRTVDGPVICTIKIDESGCLSITGVVGPRKNGNCRGSCGQINGDEIFGNRQILLAPDWSNDLLARFREIWDRYHLNHMNAGSPNQMHFLRLNGHGFNYTDTKAKLTEAGLNPDSDYCILGKPYEYGSAWLVEALPDDVVAFLESLPSGEIPDWFVDVWG